MFKPLYAFFDYIASCKGVWEYMSNYALSLLTLGFYSKDISAKIKAKFDLESYFWLINMITEITYYKKDVFVIADINIIKSLIYQLIPEITMSIILVISPNITFIENQMQ